MNLRHSQSARGFTLLEIMVALFLLAFVVAAVYASWMAILRGSKSGLTAAAEVQRLRIAMQTLEVALTSARSFEADPEYYSFNAENGSKASLSFVSYLPKMFSGGARFDENLAVRRVTFSIEPGRDRHDELVLRQSPMMMDWSEDERNHPVVLLSNVKKFTLEFWDERDGKWMDDWTQTNRLPPKVKINLQLGDDRQSRPREEISRIVQVPAMAVQARWQGRAGPGTPPP